MKRWMFLLIMLISIALIADDAVKLTNDNVDYRIVDDNNNAVRCKIYLIEPNEKSTFVGITDKNGILHDFKCKKNCRIRITPVDSGYFSSEHFCPIEGEKIIVLSKIVYLALKEQGLKLYNNQKYLQSALVYSELSNRSNHSFELKEENDFFRNMSYRGLTLHYGLYQSEEEEKKIILSKKWKPSHRQAKAIFYELRADGFKKDLTTNSYSYGNVYGEEVESAIKTGAAASYVESKSIPTQLLEYISDEKVGSYYLKDVNVSD